MADGAVLAHDVLVLKHDARPRALMRAGVRPAREIHDLVRLDPARARIDRVGTDAGEVVDLPRGDLAVAGDADFRFYPVIAGVDVGDEALQAIGYELDRALEQLRQRHGRHLVGVDRPLDAQQATA